MEMEATSFRESAEKLRKEQKLLKKALRIATDANEVLDDLAKWQRHRTDFCCQVTESDLPFEEKQDIFRILESEDVRGL